MPSRFGRRAPGWLARLLCAVSVLAVGLVAQTMPAAADHQTGTWMDRWRYMWGSGPDDTDWRVDWTHNAGHDAACGPDLGGDGWKCTAAVAHHFRYTGYARGDSTANISQFSSELFRGTTSSSGSASWADTASATCSFGWDCAYPDDGTVPTFWPPDISEWRSYTTHAGGYWWIDAGYNYECLGCSSTQFYNSQKFGMRDAYPGYNGTPLHLNDML